MTYKMSRRSGKYAFFCASSLLSLAVSFGWLLSIAPSSQEFSREETRFRQEKQALKNRQEFLRENAIEVPAERQTLSGFVDGRDDLDMIPELYFSLGYDRFEADQAIRLLDEPGKCIGVIISSQLFLERDNPGVCRPLSLEDIKDKAQQQHS